MEELLLAILPKQKVHQLIHRDLHLHLMAIATTILKATSDWFFYRYHQSIYTYNFFILHVQA